MKKTERCIRCVVLDNIEIENDKIVRARGGNTQKEFSRWLYIGGGGTFLESIIKIFMTPMSDLAAQRGVNVVSMKARLI